MSGTGGEAIAAACTKASMTSELMADPASDDILENISALLERQRALNARDLPVFGRRNHVVDRLGRGK
jgi:hypothetical protein